MSKLDILKRLQADSMVFFMKTHNYHWNVKGRDFPQVHAATEEIYNTFATVFDDLAERIIQIGGVPHVTLKSVLENASIKENDKTQFNSEQILKEVLADYEYFLKSFRELSKISSDDGDVSTQGYADSQIAHLEKAIWMIKAQLA